MGQVKFLDGYSTLAICNGMRYLFSASDVTEIDTKTIKGFWELLYKDKSLYIASSNVRIEDGVAYFDKEKEYLIAKFDKCQ